MNLILLDESDRVTERRFAVEGRRAAHIAGILKADSGDKVRVGLLGGQTGLAEVFWTSSGRAELDADFSDPPPPPGQITLILALPRPKFLRRILAAATSMGVARIILLGTWKVEKAYWSSPLLSDSEIRSALIQGLEQARDTRLPEVSLRHRFKPFVEDELPGILTCAAGLAADPRGTRPCPSDIPGPVVLAVGPEGGFTEYEASALESAGLVIVGLGPRILGVETAVPALLGRIIPA